MLTRLKAQRARENKDCEMGKDWIDHGPRPFGGTVKQGSSTTMTQRMAGLHAREHESCYLRPKTCFIAPMVRNARWDDTAKEESRGGEGALALSLGLSDRATEEI
jgi:hypothetical protein